MSEPQVVILKSIGVAYVLWFFFGGIGVHRFYTGRIGSAVGMLILGVFTIFLGWITLFISLYCLAIWWVIDAFLIPNMCKNPMQRTVVIQQKPDAG